jgi:serine/threonine protein kinase/WD40 repeat protein
MSPSEEQAPAATAPDDPRVIAAVEEYLAALDAGRRPDRAQFLARYPGDVAAALAECLDGLELVRSAGLGLRPPPDDPPATLGDFRLLREVGRGGMGVVYEAEQISLRRRVALKVLSLAGGLDDRQLQRFRTEAQAAAGLHHPHIAPVHAVGCERGVHYYAMQFIDGPSLAEVIADLRRQAGLPPIRPDRRALAPSEAIEGEPAHKPATLDDSTTVYRPIASLEAALAAPTPPHAGLSTERSAAGREFWQRVARLGVQAAEALDHAHQQGVLHRDVKPANLLLDGGGRLWVVDFGLARLQGDPGMTRTGDLVGTLRYMSPEQALAKRVVIDQRTDIYSLGVTLYELLTLTPAFPGDDRQEVLRRIADEEPPLPQRFDGSIPADLETVVLKAMAKEPAERYATAQDLADDLRRFLEDRPIVARRPSPAQLARRWVRRHRPLVASLSVAAALLVAGLIAGLLTYAQKKSELAGQSDAERQKAEVKLYASLLKSARAARLARQPGYRAEVWDNLRQAAELNVPGKDPQAIAAEALACLGDAIGLDAVSMPDAARLPRPPLPPGLEEESRKLGRDNTTHTAATPDGNYAAASVGDRVAVCGPPGFNVGYAAGRPATSGPQPAAGAQGTGRQWSGVNSPLGQVYDLELTRDGTRLAAGCEGGLAVWTLLTTCGPSGVRCSLVPHSLIRCGNVSCVALHPEGWLAATLGRQLRLWSFPDGRAIGTLPVPDGTTRVEFSADGQLLLAVAGDRAVTGWPVGDTPEKRRLQGKRESGLPAAAFGPEPQRGRTGVPAVAFSPDGRLLASVSKDKLVKTWDHATGRLLCSTWGHNAEIEALAFSPDGRLLATGDIEGSVFLWDAASEKGLTEVTVPGQRGRQARPSDPYSRRSDQTDPPGQVWRLQFDGTGQHLAAAGGRGVAVWSLRPRDDGVDVERCGAVSTAGVYDLAFHPSGSALAYLAKPGREEAAQLFRYDLAGGEGARPLGAAARLQIRGMNFDSAGRRLTYLSPRGELARWDWDWGIPVAGPGLPASQWAPAPGGHWAATAGPDGGVVIYDLDAGARVLALPPEDAEVWCLAWSPDGQRLAAGLSDGVITVWDLEQVRACLARVNIVLPPMRPPGGADRAAPPG